MTRLFAIFLIMVGSFVLGMKYGITSACADTWLVSSITSHHFDGKQHNERNLGIGLEYELKPSLRFGFGEYHNSQYRSSRYFGGAYTPWKYEFLSFGWTAGIIDGYGRKPQYYWPMGGALIVYEHKNIGFNLLVTRGVMGLQIKGKF